MSMNAKDVRINTRKCGRSMTDTIPNAHPVESARYVYVFHQPLVGIGFDLISTKISPMDQFTLSPSSITESSVKSKELKRDV